MATAMITTTDNPYNPWVQFDEWYAWDEQAGYHTTSLLARVAWSSNDLSEADQDLASELAISEIIRENVLGIYTRAVKPS